MVQLEEVEDETFESKQLGPDNDDEYYTDTGITSPLNHTPIHHTNTFQNRFRNLLR